MIISVKVSMKKIIVISFLAFVSLLVYCACDSGTGKLMPLKTSSVILAFGDSITYGTGAKEGESYPEVLSRLTGFKVISSGVPGEITKEGLARLPVVLDEVNPDLVILCHGGNDILRNIPQEETESNLEAMIGECRKRHSDIILIGVPAKGLLLETSQLYKNVAGRTGISFEKKLLADILSKPSLKADYIHPNASGYNKMAEGILSFMKKSGAVK